MKLTSSSFSNNGAIPAEFAFCSIDPVNKITMSKNRNPQLAWSGAPAGTKSFALVCHDYDVPSVADDVNKEGKSIPASLPRVDFYHWVLVDLPERNLGAVQLKQEVVVEVDAYTEERFPARRPPRLR